MEMRDVLESIRQRMDDARSRLRQRIENARSWLRLHDAQIRTAGLGLLAILTVYAFTIALPRAAFTRILAILLVACLGYLIFARVRRLDIPQETEVVLRSATVIALVLYLAIASSDRAQASFDRLAWSGLMQGSILALAAIGLTLVYGILNLTNFAHGDFVTLGAYFAFMFVSDFGADGTLTFALVLAGLAIAIALLDGYKLRKLTRGERSSLTGAGIVLAAGAAGLLVSNPLDGFSFRLAFGMRISFFLGAAVLLLAAFVVGRLRGPVARLRPALAIAGGISVAFLLAIIHGVGRISISYVVFVLVVTAVALLLAYVPRSRPHGAYIVAAAGAVIAFLYSGTLILAALLSVAGVVAFVIVLDVLLWRRLRMRRASILSLLIISIGVALALRHAIALHFGVQILSFGRPIMRPVTMGNIRYTEVEVMIIGIALALIVATGLFLKFTRVGKAMRALADNPDLARVSGIDVDRVILYVWAIAGALASVAGVLFAYWRQLKPTMGWEMLLPTFASVILGGIGSAFGALAGAYTIGFAMEMSTAWIETGYKPAVAFIILIAVLLVRPQGLLGGKVQ